MNRRLVVVLAASLALALPASALAITNIWTRQFGTTAEESVGGIAIDPDGIVVGGTTNGSLAADLKGPYDAFVRRYSPTGQVRWTRQFGTTGQDIVSRIASDKLGVTVAGDTDGRMAGSHTPTLGVPDVFVRRYDRTGALQWTHQFGGDQEDIGGGVATNASMVVVSGTTFGSIGRPNLGDSDAFVRRLTTTGALVWTRQFGTGESDSGGAVALDSAGITVGGGTDGDLVGPNAGPFSDAMLRRYDLNGNVLWTRQWGKVGDDQVLDVAADATGLTVVGYTHADAEGEVPSDAFIRRYDFAGTLQWSRIFGTTDAELAWGVAADAAGIAVTGYTFGALDGKHQGGLDVFVRRYDRETGAVTFRRQFGTTAQDLGIDVATGAFGFTVVGHTNGALGGPNIGELDIFVRHFQ
jgi:hypothetical protein